MEEEDILGKRKREFVEELETTKRLRGREIALLERLIEGLPEIALTVMYELPYPTIRNFCAVSKTIARFCGGFLDDAFWQAAWLSDRRVFTPNEHATIDDDAHVLLRGEDLARILWRTLHLPDDVHGDTLKRDVVKSPRAHIWARYEAVLLDRMLQETLMFRLGGTWRRQDSAFPYETQTQGSDSEPYIAVLSDGKNGTVRGSAWWDGMGGEDPIIAGTVAHRGQGEALLGDRAFERNEVYPARPIAWKTVREATKYPTALRIVTASWGKKTRKLASAAAGGARVDVDDSYPDDPDGADARQISPDQDEYAPVPEMSRRFLMDVAEKTERGPRLVLYALPKAEKRLVGDYSASDGMAVVAKRHAIVLFNGKDYRLRAAVGGPKEPSRFITYGDRPGRPALLLHQFDAVHQPIDSRVEDPLVESRLVSSVRLQVELERNTHQLEEYPPTLPYHARPGTYQAWMMDIRWTTSAFRSNIMTDRVLQERFVDAGDRARRHGERTLAFADVARVPRDEDAGRYLLRRIDPLDGERPYEVIWDRRTGFPFCHHRGLPVDAFAERFRTEREPSFCPDNACNRAHVLLPSE